MQIQKRPYRRRSAGTGSGRAERGDRPPTFRRRMTSPRALSLEIEFRATTTDSVNPKDHRHLKPHGLQRPKTIQLLNMGVSNSAVWPSPPFRGGNAPDGHGHQWQRLKLAYHAHWPAMVMGVAAG
jgi:hypothetical protein